MFKHHVQIGRPTDYRSTGKAMAEPLITFLTAIVEGIDYSTCRIVIQNLNSSSAGHINITARVNPNSRICEV